MNKDYPRAVVVQPKEKNSETVQINSEDLIDISIGVSTNIRGYFGFTPMSSSSHILEVRDNREFKNSGFFLSDDYDWQIVRDSAGTLVLVPTLK